MVIPLSMEQKHAYILYHCKSEDSVESKIVKPIEDIIQECIEAFSEGEKKEHFERNRDKVIKFE